MYTYAPTRRSGPAGLGQAVPHGGAAAYYIYIYIYIYTYVNTDLSLSLSVCIYIYIYIYSSKHFWLIQGHRYARP